MSRFGPARLSGERGTSPPKRSTSPQSSPKKKAFVSTIKSKESFGTPPPLPPVTSPDGKWNLDILVPDVFNGVVAEPDALSSSHTHLLQRQTVRWLNLSLNLWSLTVLDVYRTVTIESIAQFLEVVSWRAHGKVNEEEFSVLYSEWVGKPEKGSKRVTVGVFGVRQLLLEKKYGEADLDLCIGIILNEVNMRLLNSSVSYVSKKSNGGNQQQQNPYSLEVCSERWLALCEELFFTLDTPGYGVLHFDEAFFYCSCVAIGMQGWASEADLEADLSLATLTAATLQFIADTGAQVSLRSGNNMVSNQSQDFDFDASGQSIRSSGSARKAPQASAFFGLNSQNIKPSNGKCEITLAMFKKYFLKRNVGEASLTALVAHVQSCVERVVRLARVSGADELYLACRPYESELGSVGSARLWQQAVLQASGHEYMPPTVDTVSGARKASGSAGAGQGHSSGPGTPPIILFLLSDAERILSGALRANELPTDGTGFVRPALGSNTSSFSSDMDSPTVANEELHECVYRVWNHFRRWGSDNNSNGGSTTALVPGRQGVWGFGSANSLQQPTSFYSQAANQAELADVQRDPLYQLILTTVLQYKSLQQLLLAALFDMTLSHFGVGEANPTGSLVVVCAGLAPNPQRMLVEMGYAEEERPTWGDVAAGGIVGMRGEDSHDTPTKTTAAMQSEAMTSVDSPIIPSPSATPAVATVATRSNEANWVVASVPIPVPPPRRRRASQLESAITPAAATTADYDSDIVSSQTTDRSKIEVDTASSSARKRASQRIQEQRRAGGLSPSGGLEESGNSSMDEDVARAKWSPLFSSSQPRDLPLARPSGVAESKPTRHRGRSSHAATIANPAASDRVNSPALSNPASSSLSDQEATLLTEILSTSDTSKQNELIERMKRLRMGETATAATIPPLPKAAPTPRVAVCRTESQDSVAESSGGSEGPGVYGQFQKLEESVLTEYDRRLSEEARVSGPGKPKAESSTEAVSASNSYSRKADAHIQENHFIPQQNSTPDETPSNIAPSDAASMGPSSVSACFIRFIFVCDKVFALSVVLLVRLRSCCNKAKAPGSMRRCCERFFARCPRTTPSCSCGRWSRCLNWVTASPSRTRRSAYTRHG